MTQEEFAREFEKAAKSLSKMRGKEVLFKEDVTEGRSQIVFDAMAQDLAALKESAQSIMTLPEGGRHLVRALNNVKTISHTGMMCFVQVIFETLESDWNKTEKVQRFNHILSIITADLRDLPDWLNEKAGLIMDEIADDSELLVELWMQWCAATVRVCSTAHSLIECVGQRRPKNLGKSTIHKLREMIADEQHTGWELRASALYLMLGNHLVSLEFAQNCVDSAYVTFPLEALEGVEILALAIEHDGAQLAEFDVIQDKLAQIRRENLYLRDMNSEAFVEASHHILQILENLPDTPLQLALDLQNYDKNERMILSAFLDDTRRHEWFKLARKSGRLKMLAADFFAHFVAENPIIRTFGVGLMTVLLENCNADASQAEHWYELCDTEQIELLQAESAKWKEWCLK